MSRDKQDLETLQVEQITVSTRVGTLVVLAKDGAVCSIRLAKAEEEPVAQQNDPHPVLRCAAQELREYFAGERTTFSFPMDGSGTPFQKSVWQALLEIPFGETRTYGEIAAAVNNPKGSRAVGMACNKNPIMIAVPCHRVVGAGGKLTGYAYGTELKQRLLDLEQRVQSEE